MKKCSTCGRVSTFYYNEPTQQMCYSCFHREGLAPIFTKDDVNDIINVVVNGVEIDIDDESAYTADQVRSIINKLKLEVKCRSAKVIRNL